MLRVRSCVPLVLSAAACIFASCSQTLNSSGKIVVWNNPADPKLAESASAVQGLEYAEDERVSTWLTKLAAGQTTPDLVGSDWTGDLLTASRDKRLLDLGGLWPRTKSGENLYKSVTGLSRLSGDAVEFLPSSAYLWLLFYNKDLLEENKLTVPASFADLEAAFRKLNAAGVRPLALSSAFGWSALAWFSALDIRFNGAEAHMALLRGTRPAGDASLDRVYQTLYDWRSSGWVSPDSGSKSWSDALRDVETGKAAFTFAAAYAQTKLAGGGGVRFVQLPSAGAGVPEGELGLVQGFAIAAKSAYPEAALALADHYVNDGAPGQIAEGYRVPVIRIETENAYNELQKTEISILQKTAAVLPQLDRALSAQRAYNLNQAMIRFFAQGSRMKAEELKQLIQAAFQ